MKKIFLIFSICSSITINAQLHLGGFVGTANYIGELNDKVYSRTKPALGVSLNYEVSDRVMLRGGITIGKVEGGDRYSSSDVLKQFRNLSFQSSISEFSLLGELTAFNLYNIKWSPYGFAGLGVYHFNPYTHDATGNKIFLKPLSTEGQGLASYPERKPYSLTQFAIPFGGGIKYNINDDVRIGLEIGMRKLFTDYMDDVSTTYVDEMDLLAAKGQTAVDISYRADEVLNNAGYPPKGEIRGNPETKDWYYFSGIHVTFRLNSGGGGKNKGYGCPASPM